MQEDLGVRGESAALAPRSFSTPPHVLLDNPSEPYVSSLRVGNTHDSNGPTSLAARGGVMGNRHAEHSARAAIQGAPCILVTTVTVTVILTGCKSLLQPAQEEATRKALCSVAGGEGRLPNPVTTPHLLLCSEGLQLGDNSNNNTSHAWSTLFSILIQFCKYVLC